MVLFEVEKKYRKQKSKSCKNKKWKNNAFIKICCWWEKEKEASGLFSSLGIKRPLSKIPLVGPLLF